MRKVISLLFCLFIVNCSCSANNIIDNSYSKVLKSDARRVKSLLKAQVKYANKAKIDKFMSTYDESYINSDGINKEAYSKLVKDLWESYDNIKYGIAIKNIKIENDIAEVELQETSTADIKATKNMNGILDSCSNSVYFLKKTNNKWKVISDKVIDEKTSMLYGDAVNLNIKLTAPLIVSPKTEYTASLEFEPPKGTFAIASIAKDVVEYPQKPAKEVYRKMPDDNILERLFIANSDNKNEYIVASIGITKADFSDLSIKLSLTGFGYQIIRVNVDSQNSTNKAEDTNVQNK